MQEPGKNQYTGGTKHGRNITYMLIIGSAAPAEGSVSVHAFLFGPRPVAVKKL
jgi:hypothetical protein